VGYEISFHYFEKEEGDEDFNREDEEKLKTRSITIGRADEEVPVERVAATIIREYTKQNIWVENVEVNEWVKKSLKCTQTKNGVRIGAKSYNLGLNEIMKWAVSDTLPPLPPQQVVVPPPQQQQQMAAPQQVASPQPISQPPPQLVLPGQQQPLQYLDETQQQAQRMPQSLYQQPQQMPTQAALPQDAYQIDQSGRGPINEASEAQRKVWPHESLSQQVGGDIRQAAAQGTYTTDRNEAYPGQERQPKMRLKQEKSMAGLQYAQRVEVCDPPAALRQDIGRFSLTPGRQYQILDETTTNNPSAVGGTDVMYRVQNDEGREVLLSCHYFRQPQAVRQEQSYYDPHTGMLRTAASYVDHGVESQNYQHQPRLLYQNASDYGGGGVGPMDNIMSRMDAAVRRRTGGVR